MPPFTIVSPFQPTGDQPRAIAQLTEGLVEGRRDQVLLGVTGSGKTFTIAQVVAAAQRPVLVLAHNKTLAAQLYQEFKRLFPQNAVEYLFRTTTITSPRRTSRSPTRTSRRNRRSTSRSTGCAIPPRAPSSSGATR